MAVDLRQVVGGFLTFSTFLMIGNMIKRDHIDPLLEDVPTSTVVRYDTMLVSKQSLMKLSTNGPWKEQNEAPKPCWKKPRTMRTEDHSNGFLFLKLTGGPEYHASQIADAVLIARRLEATLVLPEIKGSKFGEIRPFGDIYDVNKLQSSLKGVVQVAKIHQPPEASTGKLTVVRIPNGVSKDLMIYKIEPLFKKRKNIKLETYFTVSSMEKLLRERKHMNPYSCLVMFESLDQLQPNLHDVINSMISTLRSFDHVISAGRFVAVDFKAEMVEQKRCKGNGTKSNGCFSAKGVGEFLNKVGFHKGTVIYLTQPGWSSKLEGLRELFPNTFTKDAIMPIEGKMKFLGSERADYENAIDSQICSEADVLVTSGESNMFIDYVVGKRIAKGKTQILIPSQGNSTSVSDYIAPQIAKKSHWAYSCFC